MKCQKHYGGIKKTMGIFRLMPNQFNRNCFNENICLCKKKKFNLETQISSVACQCHRKLKKEVVWNTVKFATYTSVWPGFVPVPFFLLHVILIPCSPTVLSFCFHLFHWCPVPCILCKTTLYKLNVMYQLQQLCLWTGGSTTCRKLQLIWQPKATSVVYTQAWLASVQVCKHG